MPVYTFRCRKCGQENKVEHGFQEPHPTTCGCNGTLMRVFDSPNIIYRGSGYYHTDKRLDKTILEEKREAAEGEL